MLSASISMIQNADFHRGCEEAVTIAVTTTRISINGTLRRLVSIYMRSSSSLILSLVMFMKQNDSTVYFVYYIELIMLISRKISI